MSTQILLNSLKNTRKGALRTIARLHHKDLHMVFHCRSWVAFSFWGSPWAYDARMKQHEDSHQMWEAKLIVPFPVITKKAFHTPKVHIPSEMISPKPTNLFWKWQAWICIELILLNFEHLPVSSSYFPGSWLLAVLKVHGHLECIKVIPIVLSLKRFEPELWLILFSSGSPTLPSIHNWKHSQNQAYLFQYIIFLSWVLPNKRMVHIFSS